ncbi:MGH1-like glycoside hydrolase domain-containing protein [Winogradskyella sp. R77965]|uniref:MGH1-like glycoside hydrolase domain-containing protein n=1 Tax=Winogradskyella sp. R77965 TaxID=3093872 RepID=UPI0037DC1BBD
MTKTNLIEKAKKVLNNNKKDKGFTIPCEGLYPFQWNWDSGFIAIGFAHYDETNAKREVEALLSAQWENGFIPHIIFHNDSDTYFPGPDFHLSKLHPLASKTHRTTGMTQPPVLGFVLKELYDIVDNKAEMLSFIKQNIDKVFRNHKHFYTHRDPNQEGLVYIYHNWESGTDNSPIWDDIWDTMNPPEYKFERRDTTHVDAAQRPSNREYDYYLHLIEIAKEHNYDDGKIAELSPFLVQDPLFNAMLIKSNAALIELYRIIGGSEDKIETLNKWQTNAIARFNEKLFNKRLGAYVHYDLRNEKQIEFLSSSSFAPIFAGIPSNERAITIVKTMMDKFGGDDKYLCASFDPESDRFNPRKYWRGPVWINLNWLLYKGLKLYDFNDEAKRVKEDSIALIERYGFYEYFDSRKDLDESVGYGGNNFSWSAALLLDLFKD